jgi:hypothetical protein
MKVHCAMSSTLIMMLIPAMVHAIPPDTIWTSTYGGIANDIGYSICACVTGGYLLAGYTSSTGSGPQSAYCVRINENGDTLWTRAYGGSSWDGAHFVHATADTCFLVAGYTESFGSGGKDMYLLKLNQLGDTIWTRTYGAGLQDCAYAICNALDGGYIVVGYKNGPSGWTKGDLWILKINENGDTLWTRMYGGTGEDYGISMHPTLDGNYIISGINSHQSAGGKDVWLLKVNTNGDTVWTKTYGGTLEDVGYGVNTTADSGYIITGYINGTGQWTAGDLWLIRTDSNGDSIWSMMCGSAGEDYGFDVYETPDHGFIIGGMTGFGAGAGDVWLVRTDMNGDTVWTRTYGGSARDAALGLCMIPDGGYALVGHSSSYGAGNADMYVIRTGPDTHVEQDEESSVVPLKHIASIVSGPLPVTYGKRVTIYNIFGQKIEPSRVSPGIYFVLENRNTVHKIIKIK